MGNGNRPAQIPTYGFTENVRVRAFHHSILLRRDFAIVAGAGKSILWYILFISEFLLETYKVD